MIINYKTPIPWRRFWPKITESIFITTRKEVFEIKKELLATHEERFSYDFPGQEAITVIEDLPEEQIEDAWSPELGWKWDLGWKILRPSLVLLWPLGPEDFATHPANPIDEILAIGGIIIGGSLMVWDFLD